MLELNLVQGFDETLQNVLTQTMINQDEIFRNQVLELHQLYQSQKILMKEMDLKISDRFNFSEEIPNSFGSPFPKHLKHELPATEMKFIEVPTICTTRYVNNFLQVRCGTCLKHEQRPINLELPASYYTNDCEDFLYGKYGSITPAASVKMKNDFADDKASPLEELKLSLSMNTDTWKKCSAMRENKIICSPSQSFINLEGLPEKVSSGDYITISALGNATNSGAKHEFGSSSSFRSQRNDGFYQNARIHSPTDFRPNFLEKKLANQAGEQRNGDLLCKIMSTRRKLLTSHEVVELDLNRALQDESSFHPNDHGISFPLNCTFSGVTHGEVGEFGEGTHLTALNWKEQMINCSNDPSALDQQDMTNSMLITSPRKDTSEVICGSTLCSTDLRNSMLITSPRKDTSEVICGSTLCSTDLSSICGPPASAKDPSCRSPVYLPNRNCQATSMHDINVKKSKEDMLYSHYSCLELVEGTGSNRFPASCKSDSIPEDVSSNENTEQCYIDMEKSDSSPSTFQDSERSLMSKKLCHHNAMPSICSEMKSQFSNQKIQELTEVDITVKNGAVLLLYFSSVCLDKNQDHIPESNRRKETCNVGREVPQYSSESYESIVLKQPESNIDKYSIASTLFDGSSLNEKDYGTKLKRGRRMKNFQKEILPGLASLSRQEICEDVRIMQGAIRSREYKKYRSKLTGISNCFSPVKCKRSRHSYVGRRYYS